MTRVVFMGSPEFGVPILRALSGPYSVAGVVTQPDKPAGRGKVLRPPAVKAAARDLGIEVIQPQKLADPAAMHQLQVWAPDLIVVAAFGQILRPNALTLPPHGCLNVHASLLPRWRGAAPIQAAILAGDGETGVTIMKMDAGLDTGPILAQRRLAIQGDDTGGSLSFKLSSLGADLLIETVPAYLGGRLLPEPQDENGASHAPLLNKQDGLLNFADSASALARRVRALRPWPGAFLLWNGAPLKVHAAHDEPGLGGAGRRIVLGGQPAVATGAGLLVLDEVQLAGRKPMDGRSFLLGARGWAG